MRSCLHSYGCQSADDGLSDRCGAVGFGLRSARDQTVFLPLELIQAAGMHRLLLLESSKTF